MSSIRQFTGFFIFAVAMFFLLNLSKAFADEFSSSNYKVLDPVIAPSGYSTSAGFQLWSTLSEVAVGTSTSSSFGVNSGFLFFPFASSPSVSVTAGDGFTWKIELNLTTLRGQSIVFTVPGFKT